MRLDLPVLLVLLLLAAAAQNILPGVPGATLKIPFLTGLAVFYALKRPLPMALAAAVGAGWLTDSGGGLPPFCTVSFLCLLALALRPLRRFLLDGSFAGVVAAVTAAALLQAVWQLCAARLVVSGGWRTTADLVLVVPAGAVAGGVAYGAGLLLNRMAGTEKLRGKVERL